MRTHVAFTLLVLACSAALAQQRPCTAPVDVVVPDLSSLPKAEADAMVARWKQHLQEMKEHRRGWSWERDWHVFGSAGRPNSCFPPECARVHDLSADAFIARDERHGIRIKSVALDRGPRRIVFVPENGKKMPEAARKIEGAVISRVLSRARPEDSFALLTAGGPRMELPFGSSRDALRAAAEELRNLPKGESAGQGVLDAVLEASTWFQPPQTGDAVFVITMGLERKHKARFPNVRDAVAARRVRVFAFQLGEYSYKDLIGGGASESWLLRDLGSSVVLDQARALAEATGGASVLENTEEGKEYKLTDERLQELARNGEQMYRAITEYYLLQLDSAGPDLFIGLAPPVLEQLPWASVVYPKSLPPCSGPATPAPAQAETTK